jgi:hypothetical protein
VIRRLFHLTVVVMSLAVAMSAGAATLDECTGPDDCEALCMDYCAQNGLRTTQVCCVGMPSGECGCVCRGEPNCSECEVGECNLH